MARTINGTLSVWLNAQRNPQALQAIDQLTKLILPGTTLIGLSYTLNIGQRVDVILDTLGIASPTFWAFFASAPCISEWGGVAVNSNISAQWLIMAIQQPGNEWTQLDVEAITNGTTLDVVIGG